MNIEERIKATIRDVPDFPKPGIVFKDITPVLADAQLCGDITRAFVEQISDWEIDRICGVESRGFLFGMMIAQEMGIPYFPIRKAGKLPAEKIQVSYDLEYGKATMEMHVDSVKPGERILVHDDLLATGGTAAAGSELIRRLGAKVAGYAFLVNLSFLKGEEKIQPYSNHILSLVNY